MKSVDCIELEHISIPAAAVVSKPIYTPAAVGAVGLPVPVNEPVLPIMFPAAVIVPDVVILFREREVVDKIVGCFSPILYQVRPLYM